MCEVAKAGGGGRGVRGQKAGFAWQRNVPVYDIPLVRLSPGPPLMWRACCSFMNQVVTSALTVGHEETKKLSDFFLPSEMALCIW